MQFFCIVIQFRNQDLTYFYFHAKLHLWCRHKNNISLSGNCTSVDTKDDLQNANTIVFGYIQRYYTRLSLFFVSVRQHCPNFMVSMYLRHFSIAREILYFCAQATFNSSDDGRMHLWNQQPFKLHFITASVTFSTNAFTAPYLWTLFIWFDFPWITSLA